MTQDRVVGIWEKFSLTGEIAFSRWLAKNAFRVVGKVANCTACPIHVFLEEVYGIWVDINAYKVGLYVEKPEWADIRSEFPSLYAPNPFSVEVCPEWVLKTQNAIDSLRAMNEDVYGGEIFYALH